MKKYFLKIAILFSVLTLSCKEDDSNSIIVEEPTFLPLFSIETENEEPINSKEDYIKGTLTLENQVFEEIKIRGRGNSTWALPKKPYQIKLDDKEGILEMPNDKKWILLANYSDKTLLRNYFAFSLGYISNLEWTPESKFVDVEINDEYVGVYQLTQKVEESSNRVNIGDDGYLLEVDQLNRIDVDDVYFQASKSNYYFNIKEPKLDLDSEEYNFIVDYLNNFEATLFSDEEKSLEELSEFIDIDSFVDWYLINEIAKNNDAIFYSSVYMNLIPGEKLKMGPIWDFDIAFGNVNYNGNEKPEGFWIKNAAWYQRLFENDEFKQKVKNRFEYFYENKEALLDQLKKQAKHIELSRETNFETWEILGTYVWPNYVFFDTYEEELTYLEDWFLDRMNWLHNNL
ncbi:CotH kinase family protein [Aureivirga marina]|uniref:CotH kinase family protein n=1 Tax=Aureivirga marina TaxID=1182451 RepID=UPI0018CA451C|nr:CotH kinase family protein [Aureivirga marina]